MTRRVIMKMQPILKIIILIAISVFAILSSYSEIKSVFAYNRVVKVRFTFGTGGKVINDPNGDKINCGSSGKNVSSYYQDSDFDITLKAIPVAGKSFIRWGEGPNAECVNSADPCSIHATGTHLVYPVFDDIPRSAAESREIRVITSWREKDLPYKSVELRTVLKKLEDFSIYFQ